QSASAKLYAVSRDPPNDYAKHSAGANSSRIREAVRGRRETVSAGREAVRGRREERETVSDGLSSTQAGSGRRQDCRRRWIRARRVPRHTVDSVAIRPMDLAILDGHRDRLRGRGAVGRAYGPKAGAAAVGP